MPIVNPITLPQEILDRAERVLEFHESTKVTADSLKAQPLDPDFAKKPYEFRVFEMSENEPLPVGFSDVTVRTLPVMQQGLGALPMEQIGPPQDMKTLATWLHFADGIANKRRTVMQMVFARTCFSDGGAFPCEIYLAAFGIDGLEPGLYHYSPREFGLRKLRGGHETLARLTRGRPDLALLKTVPAALLVSTVFARSTWRFGKRGYRHALHDAGYLVQNLVTVANALGIQTMTRLQLNDAATRELIGVNDETDFADAEAVQAMVIWADRAQNPIAPAPPPTPGQSGVPAQREVHGVPDSSKTMPPIERTEISTEVMPFVSILAAHSDCVAPGVAVREVRPPLTETSPLPQNAPIFQAPPSADPPPGEPIRKVLLTRQATSQFGPRGITMDDLFTINRLAFRGGTFFPLHPDGSHVALVRPFWFIHDVTGMQAGVWGYSPMTDQWTQLRLGTHRKDAAHLAADQPSFGQSAATCFTAVNLNTLMNTAGPDLYRLAHLESGIVTNRIALSSEALNLAWFESGLLFEEEARQFLGLHHLGWELLTAVAVGSRNAAGQDAPDQRP